MLRRPERMAWMSPLLASNGWRNEQVAGARVRFAGPLTHTATAITVAGALVPVDALTGVRYGLVIAVGLVFAVLGTWGVSKVELRGERRLLVAYFALMSVLAAALIVLSGGQATIAVMPLLSHAVLFGSMSHALGGSVLMLALVALTVNGTMSAERLTAVLVSFGGAIAFVLIFSMIYRREAYWRAHSEQLREQLADSNQQLRMQADHVEQLAAARERNRVASELHDGLGHYLTGIHVQLEAARALLTKSPETALKAVGRAQVLSRQGLTDVRQSVSLLREGATVGETSLVEALQAIVHTWSTDEQRVELVTQTAIAVVNDRTHHALRRILQEALSNVQHHAGATRTTVTLRADETHLELEVQDDGKGAPSDFDKKMDYTPAHNEPAMRQGVGLSSIRERVASLNGQLTVSSDVGRGFCLQVRVPI